MTRHLLVALTLAASTLLAVNVVPVWACKCAFPRVPKVELQNSTAVFAGTVTDIKEIDRRKHVTFAISKVWKGITVAEVSVITALGQRACGYPFQAGKEYLVYARAVEDQPQLHTSTCTRTKPLADAKEDLAEIGDGSTPAPKDDSKE